jgi:hypothetical protein
MKKVASLLLLLIGVAAFSGAYACDGKGNKTTMPGGPVVSTPSGTTGT